MGTSPTLPEPILCTVTHTKWSPTIDLGMYAVLLPQGIEVAMEGTIVNVCFAGFFFSDQLLNANAFRGTSVLDHLLFPDHTFYKASSAFLWLQ